ncbi:ribosome silencing factor [Vibrio metschnikovii]|uniref:Ribosomal silencing factor RsfS n=1 Tax=Vibrio metschnikovii TaxID=28172 RepID=A0A9X0UHD2_VIBME|nr:ribosome silencing factor [Vibrio metschnikovii]EKO3590082.1 ribosome silencing factor [Vibrio metschnikovii]EKO3718293.1 ribosome silencing factor [Vibrio metschnikovii]EKO3734022.1 ribosome silencing factor [Vibrio metschnikovii]EKO3744234.1 ribosome silencing factor [Vibrio metschnikovii]EKO3928782.1 ribosome silencing factor [Vibrio metschnikovii]
MTIINEPYYEDSPLQQQQQLTHFLADKADDMKAVNIVTLDVQGKSSVTDYMVICTGTSKRHVASIADHIASEVKKIGLEPLGMDGEKEGEWVVLDMGSTMLHVMQEEHRALYQLEKLWG